MANWCKKATRWCASSPPDGEDSIKADQQPEVSKMPLSAGCLVYAGLESWFFVGLRCAILLFIEAAGVLALLRGPGKTLAIPPLLAGIWCLALGGWTQAHATGPTVFVDCGLPPHNPSFIPTPQLLSTLDTLERASIILTASVFTACIILALYLRRRKPRAALPSL
jgi:hypothetical protein